MSMSVAGDRSQADGDDINTAAAPIADDTPKSDGLEAPHDSAAAQDAAPPSFTMSASVAGVQSQADGDDTGTAAAPMADNTTKPDGPKAPAAPPAFIEFKRRLGIAKRSAKLAAQKERAAAAEREKAAAAEAEAREIAQAKLAPISHDTTKSDDLQALVALSAHDDAAGTHALGDAVMVVAGGGRRSHEGIVRFVGATRFAPRVWGWRVAL